jgi:CBS domain-containing protein
LTSEEEIVKAVNSPVKDCMRIPVTASPLTPLSSLIYDMVNYDIGAVIVIEKEKPVGIITEKDVLEKAIIKNKNMYKTTANEIMSKPLISIESDHSIKEALEIMRKHQIRRLAVTEKDALIGIVTERRLLVKFLNQIY